jgi:hypothetical protein
MSDRPTRTLRVTLLDDGRFRSDILIDWYGGTSISRIYTHKFPVIVCQRLSAAYDWRIELR